MVEIISQATIKVEKAGNEYALVCGNNCNVIEAYQAWQEIGDWLLQKIQEGHQSRELKKEEDPKVESIG